jgi:periodic tryptophan protein 2
MVVDIKGQSVLLSISHKVVLHHLNLKGPTSAISFSPDGTKLVTASNGRLKIWRTPSESKREFSPFVLEKNIMAHSGEITSLDWTLDSRFLLTASRDMTARIFDLKKEELNPTFTPTELRAHHHQLEGAFFVKDDERIITVAQNGSCYIWRFHNRKGIILDDDGPIFRGHLKSLTEPKDDDPNLKSNDDHQLSKDPNHHHHHHHHHHYLGKVSAVTFNKNHNLLVAAFSNGTFGLYSINPLEALYTLSLTRANISSLALNSTGEWLALGASEGQLIVWEWRSESFILKQQGHLQPMRSLAYSPDGQILATGSSDGKIKLWTEAGLCFVTFTEHTAAITAVEFSRNGKVLISASSDGTIRAYDLLRYRNFRIMTTPTPVQFYSLAVDPSGEIIAAGTLDTHEIYLWSLQTGQLLEVLAGHTGPISALVFDPIGHRLASGSWDRTVRLWDVFKRNNNSNGESLDHPADVLALSFRSDGQQLAVACLSGEMLFWDVELATVTTTIDARRDFADRPLSPAVIKSLCYTPDGTSILVGGSFPFLGLYDVHSRILLRRYPLSRLRRDKPEATADIIVEHVRVSPTNRAFAAITEQGLVIFSRDESLTFDPFDLELDLTPESIQKTLTVERHYLKAFIMSLRLNIPSITEQVFSTIPSEAIPLIARGIPEKYLLSSITFLAGLSTHRIELLLCWVATILDEHALFIRQHRVKFAAPLRQLYKVIHTLYTDLGRVSNETVYLLDYLVDQSQSIHSST